MTRTMSTPPRPSPRAGDVVVLRGSEEYVEGEVIAVLCYGAALAGTAMTAYLLWTMP